MGYHSQGNEDQIIGDLLKKIGITNGWFVEFGAKDGRTLSNTAHLMEDFGWSGVYIEANKEEADTLKANMADNSKIYPIHTTITAENINETLSKTPLPQDFDLLSIDIDGNDYWIWQAMTYTPKIVCIEYNSNFNPTESVSLKYDPTHIYKEDKNYGASALALTRLGKRKGYRLVAFTCILNLIFIREDLAHDIPELDINLIKKVNNHPGEADNFIQVD